MPAKINIEVGVKSQKQTDEPFRPTTVIVQAFHYVTDDAEYIVDTGDIATDVFDYLQSQREQMWENGLSFHITLENITEVVMGKGVIVMPKGHRDGAMTGEEASSTSVIKDWLNSAIADIIQKAKY